MSSTVSRSARPGWLLDETASAGRENLDPGHVSRYDGKEDARAADEIAVLHRHGLHADSVVVDLGAGTGQFAIAAAGVCRRVVAVDVSPVMVDALRANVRRSGRANVDVVAAGFLTYEHAGPAADVVYSRYALHHLPDAWKAVALARIRALLAPGGLFRLWDVVYDFPPAEATGWIERWCAGGSAEIGDGWAREELEEHVRDEHSTFTWLLEPMLVRCGFEIRDAAYSGDGFFARYLLVAR